MYRKVRQTDLSDGPLPLAAPALSAALLGFLLLLRLGSLLHVRHSFRELVLLTCGQHAVISGRRHAGRPALLQTREDEQTRALARLRSRVRARAHTP